MDNLNDIKCPQFVQFDSEDFQKSLLNPSVLSDVSIPSLASEMEGESMNLTDISDVDPLMVSGDLSCASFTPDTENSCYPVEPAGRNQRRVAKLKQPVRSKGTVPKPFKFLTDSRVKVHSSEQNSPLESKDFVKTLRQATALQPIQNRITEVVPFRLAPTKKRKCEDEYIPAAELISNFQKEPRKYRLAQKDADVSHHPLVLTDAKAPNLQAMKRRRVVTARSQQETEEAELKEMQAHQFHARPLNRKVFEEPSNLRMYLKKRKSLTKPRRGPVVAKPPLQTASPVEKFEFKARPVPKAILAGTTGLKEKQVAPVTAPIPPNFVVDKRLEKRKQDLTKKQELELELQQQQEKKEKKIKPPAAPKESQVKLPTQFQPFSFDQADKQRFLEKEKKIQEEIENKNKPFVFRAQLMPCPSPAALPQVAPKPATQPAPFNFNLDARIGRDSYHTLQESKMEEVPHFKAQPASVLKREPFIPEKAPKPVIGVAEFKLETDRRAAERQQQKAEREEEEKRLASILEQQRAREEELQRQELTNLRKELVHKAQPVPNFTPFEIKPSDLPLTEPQSPEFETDKRLLQKKP